MTSRSVLIAPVLLLSLVLLGCGGSEYRFGNQPREQYVTGQWVFQANSTTMAHQYQGTATLSQVNLGISGTVNLLFDYCAPSAQISGQLSNGLVPGIPPDLGQSADVTLTLQENVASGGAQEVDLSGSAASNGNSMSGTYTAPPGSCTTGDVGNWTAYKQ